MKQNQQPNPKRKLTRELMMTTSTDREDDIEISGVEDAVNENQDAR